MQQNRGVSPVSATPSPLLQEEHCTTLQVARMLGMAVRSVQMMVDRGLLDGWKTPGGHRRITRSSVQRWMALHRPASDAIATSQRSGPGTHPPPQGPRLLLIQA